MPAPTLRALEVVVIDDNPDCARTVEMLLNVLGHKPYVFHSAEAAIEQLDDPAYKLVPDLILSDIGMPGMNGDDLAAWVRSQPRFDNVVLAAISGRADVDLQTGAVVPRGGSNFHFEFGKPMRPGELQNFVDSVARGT